MTRRLICVAAGIAFIVGVATLGGCGQSGPLYLPPPAKHASAPAHAPTPTPATAGATDSVPASSSR